MPCRTTDHLPGPVSDYLLAHAPEIFLDAFNSAYEEYAGAHKRLGGGA